MDDAARPIIVCAIDGAIEQPLCPRILALSRRRPNHRQHDGRGGCQVITRDLLKVHKVAPASHHIGLFSWSIFLSQIQSQDVQIRRAIQTGLFDNQLDAGNKCILCFGCSIQVRNGRVRKFIDLAALAIIYLEPKASIHIEVASVSSGNSTKKAQCPYHRSDR